jgi:hypothetical protein
LTSLPLLNGMALAVARPLPPISCCSLCLSLSLSSGFLCTRLRFTCAKTLHSAIQGYPRISAREVLHDLCTHALGLRNAATVSRSRGANLSYTICSLSPPFSVVVHPRCTCVRSSIKRTSHDSCVGSHASPIMYSHLFTYHSHEPSAHSCLARNVMSHHSPLPNGIAVHLSPVLAQTAVVPLISAPDAWVSSCELLALLPLPGNRNTALHSAAVSCQRLYCVPVPPVGLSRAALGCPRRCCGLFGMAWCMCK